MLVAQMLAAGRPMEIDVVLVAVQRFARAAGVATPHLDALTAILRQKACNLGLYALAAGANGRVDHA